MTASGGTKTWGEPTWGNISLFGWKSVQKLLEKIKSCFGAVSASQAMTNLKLENNEAYEDIIDGQKDRVVASSLQIIYGSS